MIFWTDASGGTFRNHGTRLGRQMVSGEHLPPEILGCRCSIQTSHHAYIYSHHNSCHQAVSWHSAHGHAHFASGGASERAPPALSETREGGRKLLRNDGTSREGMNPEVRPFKICLKLPAWPCGGELGAAVIATAESWRRGKSYRRQTLAFQSCDVSFRPKKRKIDIN